MNRNKKTKNVKQNKAIDTVTAIVDDIVGKRSNFHDSSNSKNK